MKAETVESFTAESDGEVEAEIEVPGGEQGFFRILGGESWDGEDGEVTAAE